MKHKHGLKIQVESQNDTEAFFSLMYIYLLGWWSTVHVMSHAQKREDNLREPVLYINHVEPGN